MTIKVRAGGVWREITGGKVYANGGWRDLLQVQIYSSSAWRVVGNFAPSSGSGGTIAVTISPDSAEVEGTTFTITSGPFNAVVTGGVAPYTYAWHVSGLNASAATATYANTTVSVSGMISGTDRAVALSVTAIDALGTYATSDPIEVNFHRD